MSAAQQGSAIPEGAPDDELADCALNTLLFAPVGFALFVREQLPNFVKVFAARGRAELSGTQGSTGAAPDVRRLVSDGVSLLRECAEEFLELVRVTDEAEPAPEPPTPPQAKEPAPEPAREPTAHQAAAARSEPPSPVAPVPPVVVRAERVAEAAAAGDVRADDLAIPDYDQLSASQVLPRLEGLAPHELEAIRRYELEHRARSSVLAKVDQLTG